MESGVFRSIDLYGNELSQPPKVYRTLYARAASLKRKVHVGEFGDGGVMTETIRTLEPDEVQHGIAAATSLELMRRLCLDRVRLNICPTSNVCLSIVSHIALHPVRILVDSGVRVSINTDDPMVFGVSVSEEYLALHRARVLSADELDAIRADSLSP